MVEVKQRLIQLPILLVDMAYIPLSRQNRIPSTTLSRRGYIPLSRGGVSSKQKTPDRADSVLARIASIESEGSGGYAAKGPVIKNRESMYYGDRAYGKYQVMGKNIPEWSKQALGRSVSVQEFLSNPSLQDAVIKDQYARAKAKGLTDEQFAAKWFSGSPNTKSLTKDILGTTTKNYVEKFNAAAPVQAPKLATKKASPFAPGQIKSYPVGGYVEAGGYGASFRVEPVSKKPYLSLTSKRGTTLRDRTAQKFDVTIPQKLDNFTTTRLPLEASQAIRKEIGTTAFQQLDHLIPLALGGSNDRINLRSQDLVNGKQPLVKFESELWRKALKGEISVLDAWRQMAKAKGLTLQEEVKAPAPQPKFSFNAKSKELTDFGLKANPELGKKITEGLQGFVSNTVPVKIVALMEGGASLKDAVHKTLVEHPAANYGLKPDQLAEVKAQEAARYRELIASGVSEKEAKSEAHKIFLDVASEHVMNLAMGAIGSTGQIKSVVATKTLTPVEKLTEAIKAAAPVRKGQEALYSAERARRTAAVARAGEKVSGEKGFFTQLGVLKGQLPKKQFDAIRSQFKQEEIDSLFNTIEQARVLLPLEKVSAKGGLAKLFEGTVPTRGELTLLRETFPEELIDGILQKRPFSEKLFEALGKILNIPRSMMASFDLSAPLRQGVFMVGRPKQFAPAFKDMFKYAFSEKTYKGFQESVKLRPNYLKMRQARLALTDLGEELTTREEQIMSSLPEHIPVIGNVIRGSNRAYTGFLNKLRADVFDDIITKKRAIGIELDERDVEDLGKFINAATGRGTFGLKESLILPKSAEKAAPVLNSIFFSPRLMASRLNLLNPLFYTSLSPVVRKEALKSLFAFAGVAGTVLGLAKLSGVAEVGTDLRSADGGKIKIGNTRYDVLGGFQQYIKLASQLISGEIVSSSSGRTLTLGEGYKPLTRKDIILRFFESKESPIASFITSLLQGQTSVGKSIDVPSEVVSRFIPMVLQDMYDISQDRGAEGLLMGLPAIFGVGSQTYGKQELVFGENPLGESTAQVRPVPELSDKIRETVLGQLPLGSSKSFDVETYFDQLSDYPREEAAEIWDKISEANPDLANQIADVVKDRELGITSKDKDLKSKGVASGDRALAVKEEFDRLKTKEEKAALWENYVRKGIITKEVARQLMNLFKDENN